MGNPGRRPTKQFWAKSYEAFRRRLIEAREEAGLTQKAAAERLGRSQSFVAKSEIGERRVDAVELSEFALVYGKPIQFFYSFVDRSKR